LVLVEQEMLMVHHQTTEQEHQGPIVHLTLILSQKVVEDLEHGVRQIHHILMDKMADLVVAVVLLLVVDILEDLVANQLCNQLILDIHL
tara:strand:- start:213 stop:479 length:267 start_codon:yes stop_codon:yes gene_type:complete